MILNGYTGPRTCGSEPGGSRVTSSSRNSNSSNVTCNVTLKVTHNVKSVTSENVKSVTSENVEPVTSEHDQNSSNSNSGSGTSKSGKYQDPKTDILEFNHLCNNLCYSLHVERDTEISRLYLPPQ
jgi:hypothetical protein